MLALEGGCSALHDAFLWTPCALVTRVQISRLSKHIEQARCQEGGHPHNQYVLIIVQDPMVLFWAGC